MDPEANDYFHYIGVGCKYFGVIFRESHSYVYLTLKGVSVYRFVSHFRRIVIAVHIVGYKR